MAVLCSCSKQGDQARTFVERGKMLVEAEQYDEAIRLFNKAIDTTPQYPDAYLQLALLYDDHLDDTTNAIAAYERFLAVATDTAAKERAERWLALARNRRSEPATQSPIATPATATSVQDDLKRKERQFEILRQQTATRYEAKIDELKSQIEEMRARTAALDRENAGLRGISGNVERVMLLDMVASNEQVVAGLKSSLNAQRKEAAAAAAAYLSLQSLTTNLQARCLHLQEQLAHATSATPAAASVIALGEAALLAATGTPVQVASPAVSHTLAASEHGTRPTTVKTPATGAVPHPHPDTPAPSAPVATAAPGAPRTYIVQPGDSLMKIARTVYGDQNKWTVLYEGNRDTMDRPNQLKVGQALHVPALTPQ